ncbi:hypothetical protein ZWY2020_013658 [Hordeum vulgare]|nr:hypothetical protein ZWY2020_013658 [Hordeum vulgare]
MASTAPAGDDKPPETAPGSPTGPDPHRDVEPPAPVTSSGDGGTSVTGTTEDFYPLPLWALAERACPSCERKRMLREKWEAKRGLEPLACPRSDDDGVPSSPSAPAQGPGTELQDPQAPPATWWCDPCEQHKKSLRDWRLRREGKLAPPPPPPPPPAPPRPSEAPFYFGIPGLGDAKSIIALGRTLQEQARRGKKRPLSVAEERGYRECDVGKRVVRQKLDVPPRDTVGFGAATRVRDALTKMMPDKRRGARRVDYSKLTPLVGSREPSSIAAAGEDGLHDEAFQIIGLHEGSSAQRFALQVSREFMRLLDPQASSSAPAGGDLDGRLDEEAIDNLLNEEGMEDIVKTSIPKAYSKEIFYDLIMECIRQYRKWLSDNADKLDKEKNEQYLLQLVPMADLTLVYDKEPENLSKIIKLMYKVGEYGPPPSGVIHAISPHLYQSTMDQLAAAGAVDILHDKLLQVIKVQTEVLHEGCSGQRLVGQVEFVRLLDSEVGSGTTAGGDLDQGLVEDVIDNLLNMEGMQDIVKTWMPKVCSKEILYELFMEYVGQYPKWLEDNKDKLDTENYDQCVKQFESMVNLTTVYDNEPENFSKIMKLMYKIGEYGPPPSGFIHAASRVYESTMEKVSTGIVELLQNYDKLFPADASPSTT